MTDPFARLLEGKDERPEVLDLWRNLLGFKVPLTSLLGEVQGHWAYEDGVYRMYHQSLKTWHLQPLTCRIVNALQELRPGRPLNAMFMEIVSAGTKEKFDVAFNSDWLRHARPVVEAFLHAKYFLEMAVKYASELGDPPNFLPSGWAAFLYLYDLR